MEIRWSCSYDLSLNEENFIYIYGIYLSLGYRDVSGNSLLASCGSLVSLVCIARVYIYRVSHRFCLTSRWERTFFARAILRRVLRARFAFRKVSAKTCRDRSERRVVNSCRACVFGSIFLQFSRGIVRISSFLLKVPPENRNPRKGFDCNTMQ